MHLAPSSAKACLILVPLLALISCADPDRNQVQVIAQDVNGNAVEFRRIGAASGLGSVFLPSSHRTFDRQEVSQIIERTAKWGCTLPTAQKLAAASERGLLPPVDANELFWISPDDRKADAYALYLRLANRAVEDYGNMMFPAELVLTCT